MKKRKLRLRAVVPVIIILAILLAAIFWGLLGKPAKHPASPTPTPAQISGKRVSMPELGFSIVLPVGYAMEQNGYFSRLISPPTRNMKVRTENFLYVSVIPTTRETEVGSIYNYDKPEIDKLIRSRPGARIVFGPPSGKLSEYFTYTRIDDLTIGGYGAKAFVNEKPWEFPAGTREYRYIVEFGNVTYLIGAYVGQEESAAERISKSEADGIIGTIKLLPDSVTAAYATPKQEGDWKSFTDGKNGLSFDYPGSWTVRTGGQNFEQGDLFSVTVTGPNQRMQTELHDGAMFTAMKPVASGLDTAAWMKSVYEKNPPVDPDRPPVYERVSFSGRTYEKVTVCGLSCFPYYHIKVNGKIYGFLGFAVGPNETSYAGAVSRILSSIRYVP